MQKNTLTAEDIQDGKDTFDLLAGLDETSKMMALVYVRALRDRQMMDQNLAS